MNEAEQILAMLQHVLERAIDEGDRETESVARVNIACVHLQAESPRAMSAFEEALASVRRAGNVRSEGILSMAFAPAFVDEGDPARGLELAQRAEEIMRDGRVGHRVLSLVQLARVLYTGFADADQAGDAVDLAVAALEQEEIDDDTDRQAVASAAGQGVLAAMRAGDVERAVALARIVGPELAERVERLAERPAAPGLDDARREEIGRFYRDWRSRWATPIRATEPRVAEMGRKTAETFAWTKLRAQTAGSSGDTAAVIAFVERTHAVSAGAATMEDAAGADAAPLTDDDLVFALGLASDPGWARVLPLATTFELVGRTAVDDALRGRCLRLAAAFGSERRQPQETLQLLLLADAALAEGADDALRAEVVNEIAVCLLNLRQAEQALRVATYAAELSERAGNGSLARMARGNVANALLQLRRIREALAIFEALAQDQAEAGETEMASISLQNVEACRTYLARTS